MDVPALTGAGGASGAVDGKVESFQDGKATVKLAGGAQVQVAVDREIAPGTPVTVAAASDGTLQLTVRTPDAQVAKMRDAIWQTLRSLVGETLASELSVPLAKGDFAAAARSLPSPPAAIATSTAPPSDPGTGKSATPPGPVFLSDRSTPVPPRGDALLAILAQVERNVYNAEFAGQPQVLLGPSGVEPSTRLLARAQPLPGGGGIWTPAPAVASGERALPDRIQAGRDGARELLRWAGVSDASPAEIDELGKALADAAKSLLDDAHPDPTQAGPSPSEAQASSIAGAGIERSAPSPDRGVSAYAAPATPYEPAPGAPDVPATVTETVAFAAGKAAPPAATIPSEAPADGAAKPGPVSIPPPRAPAGDPSNPSTTASVAAPGDLGSRTAGPSPAQLPADAAVRVLLAWSLDLPKTQAVQRATLGQTALDLPQAVADLEKVVQGAPGRHPALEAALQGLRDSGKLPSPALSDGPRRNLESAVLEALVRETSENGDAEPLRKAAESLLSDRLPDRTSGAQGGQTYWAGRTGDWEKARIVVRDERQRKGKGGGQDQAPSRFHAVDIGMDPKGLGRVDAHLELKGQILTTRLEAADPATAELLRRRLPELSEALSKLGLVPGGLDVREKAPAKPGTPRRRGSGGSLDVRA